MNKGEEKWYILVCVSSFFIGNDWCIIDDLVVLVKINFVLVCDYVFLMNKND